MQKISDSGQVQIDLGDLFQIFKGPIGQGSHATVYKAIHVESKEFRAIKQISLDLDPAQIEYQRKEIEILNLCQNQNINLIKFYGSLETQNYIYLILEYCSIDLLDLNYKYFQNYMPEQVVVTLFVQIVDVIKFLQKQHVIHRDLKLDNIMFNLSEQQLENLSQGNINVLKESLRIIDLGVSKILVNTQDITLTLVGSPFTVAPEVLQDIYSLGVILYTLMNGKYPYQGDDLTEQIELTQKQDANFDQIQITDDLKGIILNMLSYNPEERLTWRELEQHPYFIRISQDFMKQNSNDLLIDTQIEPKVLQDKTNSNDSSSNQQKQKKSQNSDKVQSQILKRVLKQNSLQPQRVEPFQLSPALNSQPFSKHTEPVLRLIKGKSILRQPFGQKSKVKTGHNLMITKTEKDRFKQNSAQNKQLVQIGQNSNHMLQDNLKFTYNFQY